MSELLKARQGLPIEHAQFYFACMTCAFETLHRRDWIHRDLKLENVMIANNGYAKLIDLGLAKHMPTGHTFTMCGTPVYMAPELVKGTGYAKGADVWALGIFLHELLASKPPFYPEATPGQPFDPRRGMMQMFEMIAKQNPKMQEPCFIPAAKKLINGMLQKKAAMRMGCLAGGFDDVKAADFFAGFDFAALQAQRLPAPFTPQIHAELRGGGYSQQPTGGRGNLRRSIVF